MKKILLLLSKGIPMRIPKVENIEEIIEEIDDLEELEEVIEEEIEELEEVIEEEFTFHDEGKYFYIDKYRFIKNSIQGKIALKYYLENLSFIQRKGENKKDEKLINTISIDEFENIESWINFNPIFIERDIPQCKVGYLPKGVRKLLLKDENLIYLINILSELNLSKSEIQYAISHKELHPYLEDEEIPYGIRRSLDIRIIEDFLTEDLEGEDEEEYFFNLSPKKRVEYVEKYYSIPYSRKDSLEDGFIIRSPSNFHDLANHGEKMYNCSGGDGSSYPLQIGRGETQIFFLEKQNIPLVTIEVKNNCVVQAKEPHNKEISKEYFEILKKWAYDNNISIIEHKRL